MAVGAVSAQDTNDTSTAIENQDMLSTDVGDNDILGDVQHTRFSIGNSTSSDFSEEVLIAAPDLEKYYNGPERFTVNLTDKNGNAVSKASVQITVNGMNYTRVTNDRGIASMAIGLNSGVYTAISKYGGCEVNSTITIKATVSGNNMTKIFRNGTQYYATFTDAGGNLLASGTEVEFNINGVYYYRYTNEKGTARMNINLSPGEYIITAKNPISTEMYSNVIMVLPSIVENYDLIKYYRNASQYSVRLLDDEGNPVKAGVEVRFNINGVFYTRTTNESGYAKLNINLGPGEYIITAQYNGLSVSNNITVLSIIVTEDLLMKYHDGSKFDATILDGQGNPLAGQKVTFNINGVFYDRISDENGASHLNINLMEGKYVITTTCGTLSVSNRIMISNGAVYFSNLQRKIDEADEGDTVYLDDDVIRGVFDDGSAENEITINKSITIDGKRHKIDACFNGRIFNIKSNNVVVKNIKFLNAQVQCGDGGAIFISGENTTVLNCYFADNGVSYGGVEVAEGKGGAICTYGNLTVIDSRFESNSVLDVNYGIGKGGAIYSNNTLTVRSSIFTSNSAYEGSAIWDYAFLTNIGDDCSFINNDVALIAYDPEMELIINATILNINESVKITVNFNSNVSGNVTVAINGDKRTFEISNASVSFTLSNLTHGLYVVEATYPGYEYFDHASQTEMFQVLSGESGTFSELQELIGNTPAGGSVNLTKDYIFAYGDNEININKSITLIGNGHLIDAFNADDFIRYRIFNIQSDNVTLKNITFTNGMSGDDFGGGAIAIYGNNAVISDCNFIDNELPVWRNDDSKGGAIVISGNNTLINGCYFKHNSMSSLVATMFGGAIYCDGNLNVINSVFEDNGVFDLEYSSGSGGAIYCIDDLVVINSTFISNRVSSYGANGGAISSPGSVYISDSIFTNNLADGVSTEGGAIHAAIVYVNDSVFEHNDVSGYHRDSQYLYSVGGAISSEEVNIHNSNFTSNSASSKDKNYPSMGGAVYSSGICNVEGSNFIKNSADKGESIWAYHAFSNVTNSTFTNNDFAIVKAYIKAPTLYKLYRGSERFLVYLTEDGKLRANAKVNININGENYVRTTNDEGIASLAVNLGVGNYNVTVTYEDASADSMIEVMSTVYGEDLTKTFGDSTPYHATFYDSKGYRLDGNIEIEFNINGVLYKRYTDEYGEASLNINLGPGKYIITAKNPVSGEMHSNTITVRSGLYV